MFGKARRLGSKALWTINGRFTAQRMTGVQRYANEIVGAIDNLLGCDPKLAEKIGFELVVPQDSRNDRSLSQVPVVKTGFGTGHAWDQFVLPFYARSGVLSLGNFGPILSRRHIVCIHDANTFIAPDSYSPAFRTAYRVLLPIIGRRAKRLATVSQFSADMLVKHGIGARDKIFIVPNGHEHALQWDASRADLPLLKTLSRPYVLLLGSKAKHKNISIVLGCAAALDAAGIDVVVVGAASSIFSDSDPQATAPNVHYVDYVSDHDLAALYGGALCLAFPSKTEGFGLPPLEAMVCGCPVIASHVASLPEVGGDAFLYAHPDRPADWLGAVIELSRNEDLRATLRNKGRARAKLFSWQRGARCYVDELLSVQGKPEAGQKMVTP